MFSSAGSSVTHALQKARRQPWALSDSDGIHLLPTKLGAVEAGRNCRWKQPFVFRRRKNRYDTSPLQVKRGLGLAHSGANVSAVVDNGNASIVAAGVDSHDDNIPYKRAVSDSSGTPQSRELKHLTAVSIKDNVHGTVEAAEAKLKLVASHASIPLLKFQ